MPAAHRAQVSPRDGPRVVVLGDLMVDLVVQPEASPQPGTDVPGRISLRSGGSAANTARWLARLGAHAVLIGAVGRDPAGRALGMFLEGEGVRLRLARPASTRTGRIGVLVSPDGERAFVADRGAADELRPTDIRPAWLAGAKLLHLPAYSLLTRPLRDAAERAVELARTQGTLVSLDLASTGPLLARGRAAAFELVRSVGPDVLFATGAEAVALSGTEADGGAAGRFDVAVAGANSLLMLAPLIVVKLGGAGASVLWGSAGGPPVRLDVPARAIAATDTTGAGDAFDAGFIVSWLGSGGERTGQAAANRRTQAIDDAASGRRLAARLRRAVLAGHHAARRELTAPRPELPLL